MENDVDAAALAERALGHGREVDHFAFVHIGSGIGIPHSLTNLVKGPVVAFGRSRAGIRFDAHDNKPVFKVCLFLLPNGQFANHVQCLARLTKLLQKRDF